MDTDCIFCKLQKDPNILWQNNLFYSRFDLYPVNPGHVQIMPKRHVQNIADLNQDEWMGLQKAIKEIIKVLENTHLQEIYTNLLLNSPDNNSKWFINKALNNPYLACKPDAYNQGVNEGKAAGRTINHLHWHIIPRFEGDVQDPQGGIRFVIPEMGNYKKDRLHKKVST